MKPLRVNNKPCISGRLTTPRNGPWTFSGVVNQDPSFAVGAAVIVSIAGVDWTGQVVDVGGRAGSQSLMAIAGSASAIRELDAQHFSAGTSLQTVVKTILGKHSATLGATSVLSGFVQKWSVVKGERLSDFLNRVADAVSATCVWRQDEAGRFTFVEDSFVAVDVSLADITPDFITVAKLYGLDDDLPATVRPGISLNGVRVGELVVSFDQGRYTLQVYPDGASLRSSVKKATVDPDFAAILLSRGWVGEVRSQNASTYFINFKPDDPLIAGLGLDNVRPRWGVPGSVKVSPGQKVVVFFEGGNPQRPFYTTYETHSTTEIRLGSATQFVALSNLVESRLSSMQTAIDTHVHTSAAPGNPTTTPTPPIIWPTSSTAASKVKAE